MSLSLGKVKLGPGSTFKAVLTFTYDDKTLSPPIIRGKPLDVEIRVEKVLDAFSTRRTQNLVLVVALVVKKNHPMIWTRYVLKLYSLPLYLRELSVVEDVDLAKVIHQTREDFHESPLATQAIFTEMQNFVENQYEKEVATYMRLTERRKAEQSVARFPSLIATVRVPVPITAALPLYSCKGLLLERIHGMDWIDFSEFHNLPDIVLRHLFGMIIAVADSMFGMNTDLAHGHLTLNHCRLRSRELDQRWTVVIPYFIDYSQSVTMDIPHDEATRGAKLTIGDLNILRDSISEYLRLIGRLGLLPLEEPHFYQESRSLKNHQAVIKLGEKMMAYKTAANYVPQNFEVVNLALQGTESLLRSLIPQVACPTVRAGWTVYQPDVGSRFTAINTASSRFLRRAEQNNYFAILRELFVDECTLSYDEEKPLVPDQPMQLVPMEDIIPAAPLPSITLEDGLAVPAVELIPPTPPRPSTPEGPWRPDLLFPKKYEHLDPKRKRKRVKVQNDPKSKRIEDQDDSRLPSPEPQQPPSKRPRLERQNAVSWQTSDLAQVELSKALVERTKQDTVASAQGKDSGQPETWMSSAADVPANAGNETATTALTEVLHITSGPPPTFPSWWPPPPEPPIVNQPIRPATPLPSSDLSMASPLTIRLMKRPSSAAPQIPDKGQSQPTQQRQPHPLGDLYSASPPPSDQPQPAVSAASADLYSATPPPAEEPPQPETSGQSEDLHSASLPPTEQAESPAPPMESKTASLPSQQDQQSAPSVPQSGATLSPASHAVQAEAAPSSSGQQTLAALPSGVALPLRRSPRDHPSTAEHDNKKRKAEQLGPTGGKKNTQGKGPAKQPRTSKRTKKKRF